MLVHNRTKHILSCWIVWWSEIVIFHWYSFKSTFHCKKIICLKSYQISLIEQKSLLKSIFFYISCVFTYFLKIFQQYESLIHNLNTGSVILMIILTVSALNHDTFGNVATKELPDISFNWNKYIMKILLIKTAVANLHLWWMIKESIYLMEQDHSMKNLLSTLSKNCHWKTWH